jgi:hypothetical protein
VGFLCIALPPQMMDRRSYTAMRERRIGHMMRPADVWCAMPVDVARACMAQQF